MNEELIEVARELGARLFALQAGLIAVIKTHPDPKAFAAALQVAEDAGMSNMQYLPWSDEQIATYQRTVQVLREQIPAP